MKRRGYFCQENKLEDFPFPESIIAAKSDSRFPDFVLRINQNSSLTGGELIELKDAKSYYPMNGPFFMAQASIHP